MFKSTVVVALAALLIGSPGTKAQEHPEAGHGPWQLIVSSGKFIPTGAQRSSLAHGNVTVAQLGYVARDGLVITTSVGWTRTRDAADLDTPRLHVFSYDIGGELRGGRWLNSARLSASPFLGAGAGGRAYDYRDLDADATHTLAGYVSAGAEVGIVGRVTVRLEVRDYLSGFKPLATQEGATKLRSDMTLMAGLRLGVR